MKKREAYPLDWPVEQKRTEDFRRINSRFRIQSFAVTRDKLINEIKRVDHVERDSIVLTTNVPLRGDGLPYANMRQPDDPGVAVYFDRARSVFERGQWVTKRTYYAVACDQYRKIEENMRAIAYTVEAMRTIQRHGSGQMLEQAMSGFAALPSTSGEWWHELGFDKSVPLAVAESKYRTLVQQHHPDRGGSEEKMKRLNAAIAAARLST